MSDFDKEAEREKLREKYGDEEEKRAATEQMSELLLKGATMTNAHCTDCGDPVFRYDGQEFCPTCQKPVARDQSADDADAEAGDHIEVADPSDDATVQFGDGETADEADAAAAEPSADAAADASTQPAVDGQQSPDNQQQPAGNQQQPAGNQQQPPTDNRQQPGAGTREIPSADPARTPDATDSGSAPTESTRDPPGSATASTDTERSPRGGRADEAVTSELSAAESLLAETVHRFARRAADTDDPRAAREHLSAAREAADALDAVRY